MNRRIIRCTDRHLDRMLEFLSAHNPTGRHHIGYFGVTPEDIRQSVLMLNLRYDRGFKLALAGQEIMGVMGVDIDKEIGRAWLYGPVVTDSEWMSTANSDWASTADALYDAVQKAIPAGITEHELFVDAANANVQAFATRHHFNPHGEMAIYYITPDRLASLPPATADAWDEALTDQFLALHEELFPRSNYTLTYMLSELQKGAVFYTLTDENELAGYFFGRAEEESGEAYVDLVGVAEPYRRSGVGRRLMLAGLTRLREMPGLHQVNLTVAGGNDPAMRLYDSLGFVKERDMVAFRKTMPE